MSVADTKFELCRNVEQVLKIGRDFQRKDSWRGEQHDTAKLLCDTIEYLRDQLPEPDPDWKATCAKCMDGDIEPDCEYYGEPNGCNSPIYGEHPKSAPVGDAAAMRDVMTALAAVILPPRDKAGEDGWLDWVRAMQEKARAALAEPPRNCDLYGGDYKMLHTAWFDWTGSPSGHNADGTVKMTFSEWLLAAAKKGGAQ